MSKFKHLSSQGRQKGLIELEGSGQNRWIPADSVLLHSIASSDTTKPFHPQVNLEPGLVGGQDGD